MANSYLNQDDDYLDGAQPKKKQGSSSQGIATPLSAPNISGSTPPVTPGPSIAKQPNFSDVQSGDAGSSNVAENNAQSISGRPMGIGRMVGGVPTFSDGSTPGSTKTISDFQLQQLKDSSAAPSSPYNGPEGGVTSEALSRSTGTAGATPTQNQGVAMTAIGGLPQSYDPASAARDYQSDLASIINKDPRSVSGTAARNAEVDRIWNRNTARNNSDRRAADATYLQQIGALSALPQGVFNAANLAGNENANNANKYGIAGLESLTSRNNAAMNYNSRLSAAEARAYALRYGADQRLTGTQYAADSRGDAMRDVATTNASRPRTNAAFEHGSAMAYSNAYTQAKQQGASDSDAIAAAQNSRAAFENRNSQPKNASAQPGATSPSASPAASTKGGPTQFDIQFLKDNPAFRDKFETRFGKGSADKAIGNQQ